jgi:hypothetical protein
VFWGPYEGPIFFELRMFRFTDHWQIQTVQALASRSSIQTHLYTTHTVTGVERRARRRGGNLASAHFSYDWISSLPSSRCFLKLLKTEVYREPARNFQNNRGYRNRCEIPVESQSKTRQWSAEVFGRPGMKQRVWRIEQVVQWKAEIGRTVQWDKY